MELRDFCGRHIFSGCELRQEIVEGYINDMDATVCLFTLDGITYKAVEDPEDGYGSYCKDIEVSEVPPRYSFPGIAVLCSMKEDSGGEKNDVLVIRDAINGKVILEVGTMNYDDYYPYAHFEYNPENMSCNS